MEKTSCIIDIDTDIDVYYSIFPKNPYGRRLVGLSVGWLVGWFVVHNFPKGREVTRPSSYRNSYFFLGRKSRGDGPKGG